MPNKFLSFLLLVSTLTFIILSTALPVNNPDIWYHLKTGEYIIKNKTIPKADFYSFTASGREWIAQWWLYDVIVFALKNRFGFNSLIYLKVAIGVFIFYILYRTLRLYHLPGFFVAPLLVFSVAIIGAAWVDRPHIFSYFYTAVLMWILISYSLGKKWPLILIPPLFLIWANTHASIPIALALIGFLIVSEVWEKISKPKRLTAPLNKILPLDLMAFLFLGAATSLINPNTYKTHLYVFKIDPEFVSQNIVEWIPLSAFFEDWRIRLFLIFAFLTLLGFFYVLLKPPRGPKFRVFAVLPFEIILVATLSYLSLSALRFTPVFVLILLPFMAKNTWLMVNSLWLIVRKKWGWRFPKLFTIHYSLFTKLALVLAIFALCFLHEIRFPGPHLGVEVGALPVAATEFIDEVSPPPNMYHVFNWGGYLMWRLYPKYKVFIDGRLDMYVPDIYQEWLDVVLVKNNWQEILDKYDVNFCLISNEPEWNRLGQKLEEDPNWILIYWDDQAGIFIRKKDENQKIIKEYGLEALAVYNLTTPFKEGQKQEAEEEYKRLFKRCPSCSSAHNKLGVLYFLDQRFNEAKAEFEKAVELDPFYGAAYFNLGLSYETRGDYNRAIDFYKKAIDSSPRFLESYKKLGFIYARRLKYKKEATYYLERYLKLAPGAADRGEIEEELRRLAEQQK